MIYDLNNKTVLITGGAGSIGSELTSHFLKAYDKVNIVVLDFSESNVTLLRERLRNEIRVNYFIGDIRDVKFLEYIFGLFSINIVIHCAAYKQVSLMQGNLYSLVQNNLEGLKNIIEVAKLNSIQKFLFISTDKAVYPKCYMGITKRLGELLVTYENSKCRNIHFSSLRLGNIMNSIGSVISIFEVQWKYFQKIFITSKEAKRYFISKNDVVKYIEETLTNNDFSLYVGNYTSEKYILTLGNNFLLKKGVIKYENHIDFIGLRSGEKITEDLVYLYETKLRLSNSLLFGIKFDTELVAEIKEFTDHLIKVNTPLNYDKLDKLIKGQSKIYFQ